MKKFEFHIDRKFTMWDRTHIEIEAETEEQAAAILTQRLKEEGLNALHDEPGVYCEDLFDTMDELTPDKNGGSATVEVIANSNAYKTYWRNTDKS